MKVSFVGVGFGVGGFVSNVILLSLCVEIVGVLCLVVCVDGCFVDICGFLFGDGELDGLLGFWCVSIGGCFVVIGLCVVFFLVNVVGVVVDWGVGGVCGFGISDVVVLMSIVLCVVRGVKFIGLLLCVEEFWRDDVLLWFVVGVFVGVVWVVKSEVFVILVLLESVNVEMLISVRSERLMSLMFIFWCMRVLWCSCFFIVDGVVRWLVNLLIVCLRFFVLCYCYVGFLRDVVIDCSVSVNGFEVDLCVSGFWFCFWLR